MSTPTGARLVQMTSVSIASLLMTPGTRATTCAACPLKVGTGVSVTPAWACAPRPSVAATPRNVESSLIAASGLWQLDELQLGKRGRRERGDGRVLDRVQLVDDHRGADDVPGRRDHPARAVPEDGRGVPRPVQRDGLVLVQLGGARRADRHRLAHAAVEGGARAGGDGVPQGAGLVENLEADVDRDRVDVGADDVGLQVVVLDHARGDVDTHRVA